MARGPHCSPWRGIWRSERGRGEKDFETSDPETPRSYERHAKIAGKLRIVRAPQEIWRDSALSGGKIIEGRLAAGQQAG